MDCSNSSNSDCSNGNNTLTGKSDAMPPEARRDLVLEFVVEHDMPLPPLAIWGGLNRQYRVTFGFRTLQNILGDLVEDGDLFRVDTSALRDGEIQKITEDGSQRRAYYFVTESGRGRVVEQSNE